MISEKERLESIANTSLYTTMSNTMTIEYSFEVFKRFLKPGNILELGPAEGIMTEHLYRHSKDITLVDGSEVFCRQLEARFPGASIVNALFEDYQPGKKFSNIVMGHVLEHVEDPQLI